MKTEAVVVIMRKSSLIHIVLFLMAAVMVLSPLPESRAYSAEPSGWETEKLDVAAVLEGKQSAMVVGLSREREVEFQVFAKIEDGWQLGTSWWVKHYSFVPENSEILIVITRVKSSGDCYAWVTFPVRPDHLPTDARGSQYHSDSEVTGAFSTTYFAYIGRPSGTYTLTVDGVDYPLTGLP